MTSQEKALAVYAIYEEIRNEHNYTDAAVAKELGFAPSTLSDWKAARYLPKLDKLAAIAKLFDVPLERFVI